MTDFEEDKRTRLEAEKVCTPSAFITQATRQTCPIQERILTLNLIPQPPIVKSFDQIGKWCYKRVMVNLGDWTLDCKFSIDCSFKYHKCVELSAMS
jgi:hypothetical protein